MSQHWFENEKYAMMVGADAITGSFFQVWKKPVSDQDCAMVAVDNQGVREHPEEEQIPELVKLVSRLKIMFDLGRARGNLHPNVDSITAAQFAQAIGLGNLKNQIFEIYD